LASMQASDFFVEETIGKLVKDQLGKGAESVYVNTPEAWQGFEEASAFPKNGEADILNGMDREIGKVAWTTILVDNQPTVADLKITLTVPRCPFCGTVIDHLKAYSFEQNKQDVFLERDKHKPENLYLNWEDMETVDCSCSKIEYGCPDCDENLIIDYTTDSNSDKVKEFLANQLPNLGKKNFPIIESKRPVKKKKNLLDVYEGLVNGIQRYETDTVAQEHFKFLTGVTWEEYIKRTDAGEEPTIVLGKHAGTHIYEV